MTPISPISQRIIAGVRKVGSNVVEGSATISANAVHVQTAVSILQLTTDYQLVIGYDFNGDGVLSTNEIGAVSGQTYRLVTQLAYANEKTFLGSASNTITLQSVVYRNAGNLLNSYVNGAGTPGNEPSQSLIPLPLMTLTFNERCLSHNVGAAFGSDGYAQVPYVQFPATSAFASDIRESLTMSTIISATQSYHQSEIDSAFSNQSINTMTFGPWPLVRLYNMVYGPLGGSDCAYQDDPLSGRLSTDFSLDGNPSDMFFALGSADMSGQVLLTMTRDQFTGRPVILSRELQNASVYDLYDFDLDTGFPGPNAARLQAGYNSPLYGVASNRGGGVFKLRVLLDAQW